MRVHVNGKEAEVVEQSTVAELVAEKGLNPDTIVVEHNEVILPKEKWSLYVLEVGDKLEIITFVGGG